MEEEVVMLVLPTRVGMVRRTGSRTGRRMGAPHPRGDGPATNGFRWGVL